jgi:hypothetical protein
LARGRRLHAALVSGGLLAGVVAVTAAGPAHGVAQPAPPGFSAYANGTALHAHAVESDPSKVADVDHAFASARVAGGGLGDQVINEMKELVNPSLPAKNAYARGGGAEVGLGSAVPTDPSGKPLLLPAIAEASAPTANAPYSDGLVLAAPGTQDVLNLEGALDPIANANALQGRAATLWNPNYLFPTLGNPLTYAYGEAADAQVLDTGTGLDPLNRFIGSLVAANTPSVDRSVVSAQTFSYLVNNGDGTCGIAEEIHQTLAPLRLDLPPDGDPSNDLLVEVGGDWVMKGVLTGKNGAGNYFTYGRDPNSQTDNTPLLSVIQLGGDDPATPGVDESILGTLSVQDILGETGLDLTPLSPLLGGAIGEPPRAINTDLTKDPVVGSTPTLPSATNGTAMSVAADAARLTLLSGASEGFQGADIRLGHFEMKANVPAGGINCELPVAKTSNVPVANTGTSQVFTVKVPNDPKLIEPFPCDITNVALTDKLSVIDGNPKMNIDKIVGPKGEVGTVAGDKQSASVNTTDSWTNGQPSLVFTVNASVPSNSGTGTMKDEATATATAANCKPGNSKILGNVIGLINGSGVVGPGGVIGGDFFGINGVGLTAAIDGSGPAKVRGIGLLNGPPVARAHVLAVTGRSDTIYLGFALAAMATAFGVLRLRRRVTVS